MSETTTTETPAVRVLNITTKEDFVRVATEYGVKVGGRGNLPKRALFAAVLSDIVAGKVKLIPTSFLSPDVQNTTPREKKIKPEVSYRITYKVISNGEPSGEDITVSLTENEIRSHLPHVKGQVGFAFATMALALHNADEDNTPGDLIQSYAVTDVARVETLPVPAAENNAEASDKAAEGEDTGEDKTDADKASEGHASEEMINAALAAGEAAKEAETTVIESAPAEVKTATKPARTRKTAKDKANA
jgi:hypothetical protein